MPYLLQMHLIHWWTGPNVDCSFWKSLKLRCVIDAQSQGRQSFKVRTGGPLSTRHSQTKGLFPFPNLHINGTRQIAVCLWQDQCHFITNWMTAWQHGSLMGFGLLSLGTHSASEYGLQIPIFWGWVELSEAGGLNDQPWPETIVPFFIGNKMIQRLE